MKFHRLKLFGFLVITERVGQIRCPNSEQVALFPNDCYELNTTFSLKYSSRSWQNACYKRQIKKHSFKKITCPNFKVFPFDFSEEINSVLKPLRMSSISGFGSAESESKIVKFLKTAFYYQFWFYTQNYKLIRKSYEACDTLLFPPLPTRAG